MNSYQRVMGRLRGQAVDRAPNFDIVMGFGMRFIGQPLQGYFLDHCTLVAAHLEVASAFEIDVVSIIADSYRECADLGAEVIFPEDGLPYPLRPLFGDGCFGPAEALNTHSLAQHFSGFGLLPEAIARRFLLIHSHKEPLQCEARQWLMKEQS